MVLSPRIKPFSKSSTFSTTAASSSPSKTNSPHGTTGTDASAQRSGSILAEPRKGSWRERLSALLRRNLSDANLDHSISARSSTQKIRRHADTQPGSDSVTPAQSSSEAYKPILPSAVSPPNRSFPVGHRPSVHINNSSADSVQYVDSDDSLISLTAIQSENAKSLETFDVMLRKAAKLQKWLDDNQDHPDRHIQVKALVESFESHEPHVFPLGLLVTGLRRNREAAARGKFADVYKGRFQEQLVAVKLFHTKLNSKGVNLSKVTNRFRREALVWRQLRHARVLAFIGVDGDNFLSRNTISMISPWMEHGTLMEYLTESVGSLINHALLIKDIASGLDYLHGQAFIHGDLHGSNVFVDFNKRAVIGDFGLTAIEEMAHLTTTSINKSGAIRWISPELVHREEGQVPQKTMSGDVFSFGRLCLSIYTRLVPYHATSADVQVMYDLVVRNMNPPRSAVNECHGTAIPNGIWKIINCCWVTDPRLRPSIRDIKRELQHVQFS